MTDDDVKRVVRETVAAINEEHRCSLVKNAESHEAEHDFIRSLMEISQKIDGIKWGFFGALFRAIGMTLVIAAIVGLVMLAQSKMMEIGGRL